jgi:hypothetical protein
MTATLREDQKSSFSRATKIASGNLDPLQFIPTDVLAQFRNMTGRHTRDKYLSANLHTVVSAIISEMNLAKSYSLIPFSAHRAAQLGVHARLWQDVVAKRLPLLGDQPIIWLFGFQVDVGESGRRAGGTGSPGSRNYLRPSLLSLRVC